MRSLRMRLFVALVGGAVVLFVAAGVALRWTIARWLQVEFDRALEARGRALVALTEFEAGGIDFDFDAGLMPEFARAEAPEFFELWLADGTLVHRSPSFERDARTRAASLVRLAAPAPAAAFADLALPDGRRGRQVRIDFVPHTDAEGDPDDPDVAGAGLSAPPAATLIVARERERLDADLRRLSLAVAAVGATLVLALAGLTQGALRVGLRSLDRLNRQVRALDVNSLSARVAVARPPEEIGAVIEQINALLARLEAGFARERRLSSDIAHELKTPIAELRSLCEVGTRWPDDVEAVRAFFADAGAIARQMERVVVNLVALARCDEGREQVWAERVSVAEVIEAAWRPLAGAAAARGLVFRPQVPPALCFETDRDKLSLIVGNLLANAVAHATAGTAVTCTAAGGGRPAVTFSNRTDDLEPADLPVMFDRFWRKDPARTGGQHAGLGLALVRALADLLGLEVTARLEPDRSFRITLAGPPADRAAAPAAAPAPAPARRPRPVTAG